MSFNFIISVWFFFMVSVSSLNSFCSCIVFPYCPVVYLCSLVAHWASSRWLFWILSQAVCRSPSPQPWLLVFYIILSVVSQFPNFSSSLEPGVGIWAFREAIPSSCLYRLISTGKALSCQPTQSFWLAVCWALSAFTAAGLGWASLLPTYCCQWVSRSRTLVHRDIPGACVQRVSLKPGSVRTSLAQGSIG